ncbi:MAG: thioredoxin domain-containing protein [Patescibacteria group bacterium]|nr:thioredoxin domain-containing protein [Patescibacteria group bacterium]
MLYDNAQLVSLYTKAYLVTKNPIYKDVVYHTLEFIQREMTDSSGGFYSSLDADSQGEEGKYYVWIKDEVDRILGSNAPLFEEYYNITVSGNWKNGENILYTTSSYQGIADKKNIPVTEIKHSIESSRELLLVKRGHRVRPRTDDKILTSWNALMLNGYLDAYRAFDGPRFLEAAKANAAFLLRNIIGSDNVIKRNYKNGKASVTGFLDDYAFTISAFINMYQATFDEKWLLKSKALADYALQHFYDGKSGMFFYTPDNGESLIVREKEIADNVIPASNSEMAKDLFVLGQYFYDTSYTGKAKRMLDNEIANVVKLPMFNSNWGMLLEWQVGRFYEVSIVGQDWERKRQKFAKVYLPNVILAGGKDEGKLEMLKNKMVKGQTMIYVCQDKLCKLPVTEVNNALSQIRK